jgi:hypothetical protein
MKRLLAFGMLVGIAAAAALTASLQSAQGSTPTVPKNIGGVVPTIGHFSPNAGIRFSITAGR